MSKYVTEDKEMQGWYNSRPKKIQDMIDKVQPDKLFRLKDIDDDFYVIVSYNENGTIKAVRYDARTKISMHIVFGLNPDNFIEINKELEPELYKQMKKKEVI